MRVVNRCGPPERLGLTCDGHDCRSPPLVNRPTCHPRGVEFNQAAGPPGGRRTVRPQGQDRSRSSTLAP